MPAGTTIQGLRVDDARELVGRAKQLSPIRRPDAFTQREKPGLAMQEAHPMRHLSEPQQSVAAAKLLIWLVPAAGFEPATNGLQNRCSTPELSRHATGFIPR
jgi:hypothetical protein